MSSPSILKKVKVLILCCLTMILQTNAGHACNPAAFKLQAPLYLGSAEHKAPQIARIWRGWTTKANAVTFERLLQEEILPSIMKNDPKGIREIQLLKHEAANEVEFTTIILFDSLEAVKAFAGEDYEAAHIDPRVGNLLSRFDKRVTHREVSFSFTTLSSLK
jgi:hypothetical protein